MLALVWDLEGRAIYDCSSGYKRVSLPEHPRASNGTYPLHRAVMENVVGRLLVDGEVVHHRDGDRANNAVSNLVLTDAASHARLHASQRTRRGETLIRLTCATCGESFTRAARNANRPQKQFCGRRCMGLHASRHPRPTRCTAAQHGTYGRYRKGCRCDACRSANSQRLKRYRESASRSSGLQAAGFSAMAQPGQR